MNGHTLLLFNPNRPLGCYALMTGSGLIRSFVVNRLEGVVCIIAGSSLNHGLHERCRSIDVAAVSVAEIAVMLVASSLRVVVPDEEWHAIGICRTADILEIVIAEEVRAVRFLHHATVFTDINRDVVGDVFLL